jgi:hypothetical protein
MSVLVPNHLIVLPFSSRTEEHGRYNSPTDRHLVRFLGFDAAAMLKELADGKGDGD